MLSLQCPSCYILSLILYHHYIYPIYKDNAMILLDNIHLTISPIWYLFKEYCSEIKFNLSIHHLFPIFLLASFI